MIAITRLWSPLLATSLRRGMLAFAGLVITSLPGAVTAQSPRSDAKSPFSQLGNLLPDPTDARLSSGAPGPEYWQQRVSYQIEASLDEVARRIRGRERIRYENHAPHMLTYLWIQLDPNAFTPESDANLSRRRDLETTIQAESLRQLLAARDFEGGMQIGLVEDADGRLLETTIVKGMMRINLREPLPPGGVFEFVVEWDYTLNDSKLVPARTGYEVFDDGNAVFCVAQWFPRLCAYTDYGGWRHKQFLGAGEYTLEFGDYDVKLTVPSDHLLDATGEIQNADEVYSSLMQARLDRALQSAEPMFIVTPDEADENASSPAEDVKTWHFRARNVRDFAFACSRKFIWDACGQMVDGRTVLCMSLYPPEGQPLWDLYATHAVAHAIDVYSRVTGLPYPYGHATAVMGVVDGGMEYPMICFNGPRPEKDGSYSDETKRRLQLVVIHEVGHNWFPMIINSDERHWMWMDEGLNTFVQGIAQRSWEDDKEITTAQPHHLRTSLKNRAQRPIMTQPDELENLGFAAYHKPATGLTILRETVLGRELFDFAFKEYCRRWAFKRPEPADFFRTMEDASGVDLDWFWRGWFYGTGYCDWEIASVTNRILHAGNPAKKQERADQKDKREPPNLTRERNAGMTRRLDRFPKLRDFYDDFDPHAPTEKELKEYEEFLDRLTMEEQSLLSLDRYVYEVQIRNRGTLVMPLILDVHFQDESSELMRFPAEIWRTDTQAISKVLITDKPISYVIVDPYNETADVDLTNNRYPQLIREEELQITKPKETIDNPLHAAHEREAKEKTGDSSDSGNSSKPPTPAEPKPSP